MDIIAAHQQGLLEQLEAEVADLAGRPRDHGQRAIVLHHLYDHSRGAHGWALAEARQALRIAARLQKLDRYVERWGWRMRDREQAKAALQLLADSLGCEGQKRTAATYRAYRMTATAALHPVAEECLPGDLYGSLLLCHRSRRDAAASPACETMALAEASENWAAGAADAAAIAHAWDAIRACGLRRVAERLLGSQALAKSAMRDARQGGLKLEAEVRNHRLLPAAFAANPAQHFYALQLALANRRRQQWREACDADEAVALAA
jgi:hypothetical protein